MMFSIVYKKILEKTINKLKFKTFVLHQILLKEEKGKEQSWRQYLQSIYPIKELIYGLYNFLRLSNKKANNYKK